MSILEKITQGKWEYGYRDGSGKVDEDNAQGAYIVVYDKDGTNCTTVVKGGRDDWGRSIGIIKESDAKAISKVPEMLNILERLSKAYNNGDEVEREVSYNNISIDAIHLLNELNK